MAYSRKKSRELVFRMLFGNGDMDTALVDLDAAAPVGPELEYVNKTYRAAVDNMAQIDMIISEHSHGYTIDRIFKTDLTALRLGVAELRFTGIDKNVAISEAVDIAKKYGTEKSGGFVNGVLGSCI